MKRLLACALVACGSPQRPPTIENIAPVDPTPEKACESGKLAGTIVTSDRDNEPAIGATVVATRPNHDTELVVITDEHGKFALEKIAGHDTLVVYYEDRTFQVPIPKRCDPVTLEIDILTKRDPKGAAQPIRVKYEQP